MAAIQSNPQLKLVEHELDDDDLAAQLDAWQEAKEALAPHRKRWNLVNGQVKAQLEEFALADGDYRCGRFAISVRTGESKRVEFERASKQRMTIKLLDEDE